MPQKYKKIGIIGGMGPLATRDLYDWIIELTPAQTDQDHLPIVINNMPQTPDRTRFLLGEGEDPRPHLLLSAQQLEQIGAEILCIPCNTAHAFVDYISENLSQAEIVNMITETKSFVNEKYGPLKEKVKIGLLATTGTVTTGLYQSAFSDWQFITPNKEDQNNLVMSAIYGPKGIKSGYILHARKLLRQACQKLHQQGADIIIFGCTEISTALRNERNNGIKYVNPVRILAKALINRSLTN